MSHRKHSMQQTALEMRSGLCVQVSWCGLESCSPRAHWTTESGLLRLQRMHSCRTGWLHLLYWVPPLRLALQKRQCAAESGRRREGPVEPDRRRLLRHCGRCDLAERLLWRPDGRSCDTTAQSSSIRSDQWPQRSRPRCLRPHVITGTSGHAVCGATGSVEEYCEQSCSRDVKPKPSTQSSACSDVLGSTRQLDGKSGARPNNREG
jgi:hypothetical protein